jgi:WbqC-like protein family
MKLGIMQPYFFPYIGYFQLICSVDRFLLYPHVQHIHDGWVHRNRILIKGGKPMNIHVPLCPCSHQTPIRDLVINRQDGAWRRKLLRMLHHNYAASAYYAEIQPFLERLLDPETTHLSELNGRLICETAKAIGLRTEIVWAGSDYLAIEESLATAPGADKKSRRIHQICRKLGADTYINPPGGKSIYDKSAFGGLGINLHFLSPSLSPYPQFSNVFQPGLSIIDVLMHNGFAGTGNLASLFTLN